MNWWQFLLARWRGSVRIRLTVLLSLFLIAVMGAGASFIVFSQAQLVRESAESRMSSFSQAFAMIGAEAVLENLFLIQEAMMDYLDDPDILEVDVIDEDDMIVAAKHPDRIGLVVSDPTWSRLKGPRRTVSEMVRDVDGLPFLIIVEPLKDQGHPIAWIRTEFSLAHAELERWNVIGRLVLTISLVTLAVAVAVGWSHRTIAGPLRGIVKRLQTTLRGLGENPPHSKEGGSSISTVPADQRYLGELEQVTILAENTAISLETKTRELQNLTHTLEEQVRERTQALEAAKVQAQQAAQAKAAFLAEMSHEIRTPMNGVLGLSELLLRATLSDDQRAQVRLIHRSAKTLVRVIDDILDLSKMEAGKLQIEASPFHLEQVLEDLIEQFQAQAAQKGLVLSYRIGESVPRVVAGDDLRLRRVLINLIGNAIKFTDHGRVEVRVSLGQETSHTVLLLFAVTDTGIGIALEDQERLFHTFSQVPEAGQFRPPGSGLGLAISRQLVEVMGGTLSLHSEVGQGSTFLFRLPFEKAKSLQDGEENQAESFESFPRPTPLKLHLLVVEDDPVNQEVITGMLKLLGCTEKLVSNGGRAIEAFRQDTFDMVFMDCRLPDISGIEAAKAIRTEEALKTTESKAACEPASLNPDDDLASPKAPCVPIIAMTANLLEHDPHRLEQAGFDDVLHKPFGIRDLEGLLQKWKVRPIGQGPLLPDETSSRPLGQPSQPQESTAGDPGPPLDPKVLESLKQIDARLKDGFVVRLIDRFLESTPPRLSLLHAALRENNTSLVHHTAHTLRSSCGGIGASAMVDWCQRLLDLPPDARGEHGSKLLKALSEEFERVRLTLLAARQSVNGEKEQSSWQVYRGPHSPSEG